MVQTNEVTKTMAASNLFYNLELEVERLNQALNDLKTNYDDLEAVKKDVKMLKLGLQQLKLDVEGQIEQLESEIAVLHNQKVSYETVDVKISSDDWNGGLSYTIQNDKIKKDKLVEVSCTVDGQTVDGDVVRGNGAKCGQYGLSPSLITTDGQLTMTVTQTPAVALYVTMTIWTEGEPEV